jgi:hypothetical protein
LSGWTPEGRNAADDRVRFKASSAGLRPLFEPQFTFDFDWAPLRQMLGSNVGGSVEDAYVDEGGRVATVVDGVSHLAYGPSFLPYALEVRFAGQTAGHFDAVHASPSGHREMFCRHRRLGAKAGYLIDCGNENPARTAERVSPADRRLCQVAAWFEGAMHFAATDLERCWLEDQGRHDEVREPAILLTDQHDGEAFLFSADAGGSSTSSPVKDVRVSEAAQAVGLSEADLRMRITGRCRLKLKDGELVVSNAELQRLANAGTIPKPSEVRKAAKQSATIEHPSTDAAADQRTAAMADALAIDLDPSEQTEAEPSSPQTFQTGFREQAPASSSWSASTAGGAGLKAYSPVG